MIDDAVDALDLDSTESGFSWYHMSKLEHQFVNIRHIQHHAGQLIDRVRSAADVGIPAGRGLPEANTLAMVTVHCRALTIHQIKNLDHRKCQRRSFHTVSSKEIMVLLYPRLVDLTDTPSASQIHPR